MYIIDLVWPYLNLLCNLKIYHHYIYFSDNDSHHWITTALFRFRKLRATTHTHICIERANIYTCKENGIQYKNVENVLYETAFIDSMQLCRATTTEILYIQPHLYVCRMCISQCYEILWLATVLTIRSQCLIREKCFNSKIVFYN